MTEHVNSITLTDLCRIEGIRRDAVTAIVEYGIVKPQGNVTQEWLFESGSVYWIKKATRLQMDLELDWLAVAMVIDLLKQKDALEAENQRINRLLQRFMNDME
ncbi:chaperone modulator CbpM [Reinekea sp. G2M2-21]|uniref:chaperone modulator CbpM n=1 Tax=Reinekea sp. G2M2-21 TaxID=2788942 RepID=UPI0018ABD39A|nr:chaperone modulator CbpM [Reinekea sp. G2M2-21]MDX1344064.1 chaperone modulator CbpM [Reinekea sp.]